VKFRIEQRIPAPLADVEAALLDRDFVAATADLPKLGAPELLEQRRDGDRAHQRIRYRFTAQLSSAVTRVVDPAKLTWIDDATYDLTSHTSRHRILPDNYADRLQASYDVALEPLGDSTRRVASGELTVHVPLVGGRVERAIVDGLEEHATAEAELLGRWIAERR
jgi:DNA-binding transcriptional regulator YbjK